MSSTVEINQIDIRDTEYTVEEGSWNFIWRVDDSNGNTIFRLNQEKGKGDVIHIEKDEETFLKIGGNLDEVSEDVDGNWIIYSVAENKILGSIEVSLSGTGHVNDIYGSGNILDFDRDRVPQLLRAYIPLLKYFIDQEWVAKSPEKGKIGKIVGNSPIIGSPTTKIRIDDPNNTSDLEFICIAAYLSIESFGGV